MNTQRIGINIFKRAGQGPRGRPKGRAQARLKILLRTLYVFIHLCIHLFIHYNLFIYSGIYYNWLICSLIHLYMWFGSRTQNMWFGS